MSDPEPTRPGGLRKFAESVGLIPPRDGSDPYAHRRGEPRGFTVIWLVFLFLAAGVVYGSVGNPVLASAEGYRLASKLLLTTIAIGLVTIWPALRLAQHAPLAGGISATARDLAIVLIPLQALIWPQSLITGWSLESVAVIALHLAAWTLIVGAVIALATGPALAPARTREALAAAPHPVPGLARSGAMALILLMGLAAPIWSVLEAPVSSDLDQVPVDTLAMCSPITAPWEVFADRVWTGTRSPVLEGHWKPTLLTFVLGLAAWAALIAARRLRRVEDRPVSA